MPHRGTLLSMRAEAIAEVWSMLDRGYLESFARRGPEPIFATVSGAHLYGFASPDSDVDLRGAVLWPGRALLGLSPPDETITRVEKSPLDLDFVAHDLRKLARLLVTPNGYVLEQIFSPLVVVTTPEHDELRTLARGCITRPLVRHYLGFARGRRERLREPDPTVKHLLYAYRVYLAGIHAMETGEIVSNLAVLTEARPSARIAELVARKVAGSEHMALAPREVEAEEAALDVMEAMLGAAHEKSALPDAPTTRDAIEDLVVRARLARL